MRSLQSWFLLLLCLGFSTVCLAGPPVGEMTTTALIAYRDAHTNRAETYERNARSITSSIYSAIYYGPYSSLSAIGHINRNYQLQQEMQGYLDAAAVERSWAAYYDAEILRRALRAR